MELHTNLEKKLPLWFLRKVDQTSVVVYPNRPRCGKILVSTRGQRESWGTTRRPFVAFEPRCLWETSHCGLKQMRDGEAGAEGARGTPVGGAPQRYLRARPLREQTGGRAGDTMKVSWCRFTLFLPITCHARLQWGVSDVPRLQHVRNELALCARPGAPPSRHPCGGRGRKPHPHLGECPGQDVGLGTRPRLALRFWSVPGSAISPPGWPVQVAVFSCLGSSFLVISHLPLTLSEISPRVIQSCWIMVQNSFREITTHPV